MKRLNKLQLKLFFGGLIIIIGGTLYYFKAMTTVNADLNINRMVEKDKIYSYTVYSDFYFHVEGYDDEGKLNSNFSQIIPTETDIGYDFSKPKPQLILNSREREGRIHLIENDGNKQSELINLLVEFSKTYSKLVAVQDQHYFNEVAKNTQNILHNLYGSNDIISTIKIDDYYENEIPSVIPNMLIKPYKINIITSNLKAYKNCNNEWCPNIVEWQFGEKDRIYLQYIGQYNKIRDLDSYVKSDRVNKKNSTIVKTTKITNNKLQKYYFIISADNSIESYIMDSNGYIYILKYRYMNSKSKKKYLFDYLKIAFGIYFIDIKNFENNFAKKQKKIEKEFKTTESILKKLDEELDDLIEHFGLNRYQPDTNILFDEKMKKYLKNRTILKEEIRIKQILLQASKSKYPCPQSDKTFDKFSAYFGCKIQDICTNIECVMQLDQRERR